MKEKSSGIPINQEEINLYLKDIRKIKVMTPEREKELSKMITSGTLSPREIDEVNQEDSLLLAYIALIFHYQINPYLLLLKLIS